MQSNQEKDSVGVQKSAPLFTILVSILVVLILGTGIYYIYTQFFQEDRSQEEIVNNDGEDTEEEDVNESDYSDFVTKTFSFPYSQSIYGQSGSVVDTKLIRVHNEVKIPSTWKYEAKELESGEVIGECVQIVVSDPKGDMQVVITPICTEPVYTGALIAGETSIGTVMTYGGVEGVSREVTVLRNQYNSVNYDYSQLFTLEGNEYADIFQVYNRTESAYSDIAEYYVRSWPANVEVEYYSSESDTEAERKGLFELADMVVLSLGITDQELISD